MGTMRSERAGRACACVRARVKTRVTDAITAKKRLRRKGKRQRELLSVTGKAQCP